MEVASREAPITVILLAVVDVAVEVGAAAIHSQAGETNSDNEIEVLIPIEGEVPANEEKQAVLHSSKLQR